MRTATSASAARQSLGGAQRTEAPAGKAASASVATGGDGARAFTSVEIHRDVASAAADWSRLLGDALAGPYQNPDFMAAWARHAGAAEGASPLIAIARDERGEPVALLPLCVRRRFGVATARFIGGSHVNYNLAVIRRDRLDAFAGGEAERLLVETAREAGVDAYHLVNQPRLWMGTPNPLASLPSQPSADDAYCGPLAPSLEEHLRLYVSAKSRSNQRRKMRRFEERGAPKLYRAETPEQRRRLLDAYFRQKAEQFAARGVDNVFERPGVYEFLAQAAGLTGEAATIDLYGFDMDDEVVAVHGGVADGSRYCGMFISITSSEHAKYSPGEMLMNFVVEEQIRRGLSSFDLGVGAATYKKMYCPDPEPLFDSIFGVTAKGRAVAGAAAAAAALKARIKATPWAYGLIGKLRKARAGHRPEVAGPAAD
ncbi:GNAT family N-acetyltransferase [Chenggangzhangella methanolivorans]|uniref:GNAT family N-acetyltransferase n=2 Tax=Chenggangzhangella methanolivorans TaxID=1437009 RepID=A0A9E6RDQ3_9HYPH|nr:GNAT family N-acetyltransferase [Chenggangzhangella methanolivorans]